MLDSGEQEFVSLGKRSYVRLDDIRYVGTYNENGSYCSVAFWQTQEIQIYEGANMNTKFE